MTVTLPDGSELTIVTEITSGQILIATLMTVMIAVYILKWIHDTIFRGR